MTEPISLCAWWHTAGFGTREKDCGVDFGLWGDSVGWIETAPLWTYDVVIVFGTSEGPRKFQRIAHVSETRIVISNERGAMYRILN